MCATSGHPLPTTSSPDRRSPTPTPVPTVIYVRSRTPATAPRCASPKAAPATSVVIEMATPGRRPCIAPRRSKLSQPGFGVDVMEPYLRECASRSSGPNAAMPAPTTSPGNDAMKAATSATADAGVRVGIDLRATGIMGFPTAAAAQTILVPPVSIPRSSVSDAYGPFTCPPSRLRHSSSERLRLRLPGCDLTIQTNQSVLSCVENLRLLVDLVDPLRGATCRLTPFGARPPPHPERT